MNNPLRVINAFRSLIRETYISAVEKYLDTNIKELNNTLDDQIRQLRLIDLTKAQTAVSDALMGLSDTLHLNNDRFDILKRIDQVTPLINAESSRYKRVLREANEALNDIEDTYCDSKEDIIDDLLNDVNVYYRLFGKNSTLSAEQVQDIDAWFNERNRNRQNLDDLKKKFIDDEVDKVRESQRDSLLSAYSQRCLEIRDTFKYLIDNVNNDRREYIARINNYVDNIIVTLSGKGFQRDPRIDKWIKALADNYGIQIDVAVEDEGALIDDETITRIYADCLAGTPNRELLIGAVLTLNLNVDIDRTSTTQLCNIVAANLGLRFD